ncbi:hypothetical protein [Clostridium butyricum]|uniref:Uncharacterized protein n=1 Tax=Clostridium butyricum TaxID=1492 RepID=A0A6N3FNC6_CLOBU
MKKYNKPLKWETPEELESVIEKYFNNCIKSGEVPTVTGLAFALGTTRDTLLRYEKNDECNWLKRCDESVRHAYRDTIKRAKSFIESRYEQALFQQGKTVGAIFTLKNNYGYVDKQEIEQTNKRIEVKLED